MTKYASEYICRFGFDSPGRPFIARFKISENIVRTGEASPGSCSGWIDRVEAKHCCKTLKGALALSTHNRNPTPNLPGKTEIWVDDYRAVDQFFRQVVLLAKVRQNMRCSRHRIRVLLRQLRSHPGQPNGLRASIG